jgi:hypothetical protein
MAINCFAMPLAGLPTRRMRFNSASVASGISEKSIWESGICFTLSLTRLPRTDDSDRFFFISDPPYRIDDEKNPSSYGPPDALAPTFLRRVFYIVSVQAVCIAKDCSRLFERDAMLLKVGNRLRDIPRKRIHVYTLIRSPSQGRCAQGNGQRGSCSGLESDAAGFCRWRLHQLADGVEEDLMCPSWLTTFRSSSLSLDANSLCAMIVCLNRTKARTSKTLMLIACGLFNTIAAMIAPCSVKT